MSGGSHERFVALPDTGRGLHQEVGGMGKSGDRVGYCVVTLLDAMATRIERFEDEGALVGGYNNALEGARRLGFWSHPPPPSLTREDFVVAVAARVAGSRTL